MAKGVYPYAKASMSRKKDVLAMDFPPLRGGQGPGITPPSKPPLAGKWKGRVDQTFQPAPPTHNVSLRKPTLAEAWASVPVKSPRPVEIGYPGQPGIPFLTIADRPLLMPLPSTGPPGVMTPPPTSLASSPALDCSTNPGSSARMASPLPIPVQNRPTNLVPARFGSPAMPNPLQYRDPATLIHPGWHSITAPEWAPNHPNVLVGGGIPAGITLEETSQPLDEERLSWDREATASRKIEAGDDGQAARKLNKFASTFAPQWVKTLPPAEEESLLQQMPPQIPAMYASAFLPLPLLQTACPDFSGMLSILSLPPSHESRSLPTLSANPDAYYRRWSALLSVELDHLQRLAQSQILYRVEVGKAVSRTGTVDQSGSKQLWQVSIPGVREDWPRIIIGDTLVLRGLFPSAKTCSRVSVEARVTGMIKRDGIVYIESEDLAEVDRGLERNFRGKSEWNVAVRASSGPIASMQNGVRRTAAFMRENLQSSNGPHSFLPNRWLFPSQSTEGASLHALAMSLKWLDQDLNTEQKSAVRLVLEGGGKPICISGPPGTGKTKTLVEAVLQVLAIQPDAKILLTAPSNAAADTLARRLAKHLDPTQMFRLQSQVRSFPEVPTELLPYCYIAEDKFGIPPWTDLLRFRVIVCNCLDADLLAQARLSNVEIVRLRAFYGVLLPPGSGSTLHWTHLMVDEAGQASEPEVLVAISVIVPSQAFPENAYPPTLVLCGDVRQLSPIILSPYARECELDVSLLERLTWKISDTSDSERGAKAVPGISYIQLLLNYRSQPGILMIPSNLYYKDALQTAAAPTTCSWSGLLNPRVPVAIYGVESKEDWIAEGSSYYNVRGTRFILVANTSEGGYRANEIGIITPWREHVWRLRQKLRAAHLGAVNVGHVEAYQGSEWRVVIISCVRSSEQFLAKDRASGSGLIFEHKRLNVALTRARELMIIVGNMKTHQVDPAWNSLLQLAKRHGLYSGPPITLDSDSAGVSRLEAAFYATQDTSTASDKHADLIAGAMARLGTED